MGLVNNLEYILDNLINTRMNWKRDIMNESLIDAIQKPGPRDLDCDRSDPNVGVFHAQVCLQIGCSF